MEINNRTRLAVLCVVMAFLIAYFDVLQWLVDDWEGEYSHGYLIAPISLYLAWKQRDALAALPVRPSVWGFAALLLSLGMLLAGTLAAETTAMRLSLVLAITSTIWFLFGWGHVRMLRFPLAFMLFMIPVPGIIYNRITFPLQLVASQLGESMLNGVGIPVIREGNLITLPQMTLEVAEACSGIRSLFSLFMLTVLYGHLTEPRLSVRWVLVLSTIPVAILVNGMRVAATGVAAHNWGLEAAEGFFHSFSGFALFIVAGLVLAGIKTVAGSLYGAFGVSSAPAGETA